MKKSRFLTFLLSLIPGCGLMYLGYMRKGLQTMLIFAASCFMAYFFQSLLRYFDWIMVFFLSLLPIIWFYQMFDSMHTISRMKRQEIEVPSDDGFYMPQSIYSLSPTQNPSIAKIIAIILILIGSFSLFFSILDSMNYWIDQEIAWTVINAVRNYLVPAIVSLALIIAGVKLLKGSKAKKTDGSYGNEESDLS